MATRGRGQPKGDPTKVPETPKVPSTVQDAENTTAAVQPDASRPPSTALEERTDSLEATLRSFMHSQQKDYVKVKQAILRKMEINAETYRLGFRSMSIREGETARELQSRLKDLYEKWLNPKQKSKEEIGEQIILEQFLRMLNPELRVWVKEHNPQTSKEAA
uniref:SCAN box domain-containing protein n=1 Tax=Cyprinus carpio carpio TaxID=630221 RepID=A0A9J7ZPS2_CYPCA